MHYKNHLEAVYCISGEGSIENCARGEVHEIQPGVLYALDKHDRHILRGRTEMVMACCFNPPVPGKAVHGPAGAYAMEEAASMEELRAGKERLMKGRFRGSRIN